MSTPSLVSLFEESSDPQTYIPRRASEEVLRCLTSLIRDGEPVVVLHGPTGIGKSMLLCVERERLESERRTAYISVTESPQPELCHRILDQLSEPAAEDPAQALIQTAMTAADGQPRILLLIDHADLAPIESSLQLVRAAQSAAPHLTVVFAVANEEGAGEFAEALSAEAPVTTLCFEEPMDPQEATAYVRLRLARTQIPAQLRARLDSRAMSWLSEGARAALPRDINRRAAQLLTKFEEEGEAALDFILEPESPPPSDATDESGDEREGPRAVDPSELPRDEVIDPQPPSFPMNPSDPASLGSASVGNAVSLGGSLLGHGQGGQARFPIDLELGRSLSSGLLEAQRSKPSVRDGGPVGPDEQELHEAREAVATEARSSRRTGFAFAAVVAIAIAVGYLGGLLPVPTNGTEPPSGTVESFRRDRPAASTPAIPSASTPRPGVSDSRDRPSLVKGPLLDPSLRSLSTAPPSEVANETNQEKQEQEGEDANRVPASLDPEPETELESEVAIASSSDEIDAEPAATPESRESNEATPSKPVAPAPIVLNANPDSGGSSQPASFVLLSIDVEAGAKVEVDGRPIGSAPFAAIFVEMGTHTFVAELPDGIRVEQMIDVQVGTEVVEF